MSDKIIIALCVVLEKSKFSIDDNYQFNIADTAHLGFPLARKLDPATEPFVVMTAESFNRMQEAVDNLGIRDQFRNELIRLHGGIVVKVGNNRLARLDTPLVLNEVGKAWKDYAKDLEAYHNQPENKTLENAMNHSRKVLEEMGAF
jgi:hypothetical protein